MIVYKILSDYYLGGDEDEVRQCVFSSKETAKDWLINNPYLHDAFMDGYGLDHSLSTEEMKTYLEQAITENNIEFQKVDFDPPYRSV